MQQYKKNLGKVSLTAEGKWNIKNAYPILSIVYDEHTQHGFISKKDVPENIDLNNNEYWMPLNVSGYADNNIIILSEKTSENTIKEYTLKEAIQEIASVGRKPGAILCFYNANTDRLDIGGRWEIWQFNSTTISEWENVESWQNIYYNYNKFVGWYENENMLKQYNPFPEIGCYAFVGTKFNEATIYRCENKYIWTDTIQHSWDYVKVIVEGNVTVGENGNWFNNGVDTNIPASVKGENGKTPVFRNNNNVIEVSYDNVEWNAISDEIAAWFRWQSEGGQQAKSAGKIQITRDGITWTDLSGQFVNNLRISRYIEVDESLPTSNIVEGTIYAKGPYYENDDTNHDYPAYRIWVYAWKGNTLAWVDNGQFTSIVAGIVQETGNSENAVMSQKAVTEKLSELGSNVGIIASEARVKFVVKEDKSIDVTFVKELFAYGIDGKLYTIPSGLYPLENNKCLIFNINDGAVEVVSADALKGILLAYNEEGRVLSGVLAKYFTKKRYDDAISNILLNEGNASTRSRISFTRNEDLSISVNYVNSVYLFGLDNVQYNIGSKDEQYNIPYNKALVYDVASLAHLIVDVNKIPDNAVLLAYNERGYISNGLYKAFLDENIRENTNADFNSKINTIYIPNTNIQSYTGYMNNVGVIDETATGFECLATDWIGVKKGDIILYKGYGRSSGFSWVLRDSSGVYVSDAIDSRTDYTEIAVPKNGMIRFSSYKSVGSGNVLVLDVLYKNSLESRIRQLENGVKVSFKRRINKTMVNVGMSIWWLDSTNFTSSNPIDGEGTLCKGYQTLLQECFEFDGVVKYSYSGYSLGLGNSAESSIMNKKAATWVAQDNSFWTLDTIVNDFGRSVQLGTVDDYINNTGISTFYGALRAFKDRVEELSPNAIVICSNALVRTDRPSKENSIGLTFEDYEKAMCYVASKEGWYFVDQNRYGGINEVNAPYTLYDGLHPTNFGFRVAVKPWIEQIGIIPF